ncbi:MAG: endonuclease NucS domain-containing protein [Phycisphaerae bacterium]|jgi:hypothetical protein
MKRFNVVLPKEDGGVEIYRMKEWLRQHPGHIPTGVDPTYCTSHKLRDMLKKLGWSVKETASEVRLLQPGTTTSQGELDAVLGDENPEEEDESPEACFALEYQLRDFIAQNLNTITIEGRRLRLYVDPTGRDGIEYSTAVGSIDILAVDDSDAFVVFELKRARSADHAIGQLTRYMGWIKQTIGKGKDVRGVIVSKTISENLRYAVLVVPNISLFEYEVEFHLKTVHREHREET